MTTVTSFLERPVRKAVTDVARKKFPVWPFIACITATTSAIGFAVGGVGMMYEGLRYDKPFDGFFKRHPKTDTPPAETTTPTKVATPATEKPLSSTTTATETLRPSTPITPPVIELRQRPVSYISPITPQASPNVYRPLPTNPTSYLNFPQQTQLLQGVPSPLTINPTNIQVIQRPYYPLPLTTAPTYNTTYNAINRLPITSLPTTNHYPPIYNYTAPNQQPNRLANNAISNLPQWPQVHFNASPNLPATTPKAKKKDFEIKGVKDLVPQSKFGEIALSFAKVGVGLSGLAGIMNGIAMKLPLIAVGESAVLGAAPNIQKNYGLGLFHIGLAGIFAGRALEMDTGKRLNMNVMKTKKGFDKVKYVLKNIGDTVKTIGQSNTKLLKNFGKLFTNWKEGAAFFKQEFFNVTPRKIIVTEMMTQSGKSFVRVGMKSSPYLMHFASTILALGGLTLTIGSFIKNNLLQRLGFAGCVTGGSMDNFGLVKLGLDKFSSGEKLPGGLLVAAGLGIFSGQHGMDEKFWRGAMWASTGVLFAVFMVERFKEFRKLLFRMRNKHDVINKIDWAKKGWEEATQMVRQFELNPSHWVKTKEDIKLVNNVINKNYDGFFGHFNDAVKFKEGIKGKKGEEGLDDLRKIQPEVVQALETIMNKLHAKQFQTDSKAVLEGLTRDLKDNHFQLTQIMGEGVNKENVIKELKETNVHIFGKEVAEQLG